MSSPRCPWSAPATKKEKKAAATAVMSRRSARPSGAATSSAAAAGEVLVTSLGAANDSLDKTINTLNNAKGTGVLLATSWLFPFILTACMAFTVLAFGIELPGAKDAREKNLDSQVINATIFASTKYDGEFASLHGEFKKTPDGASFSLRTESADCPAVPADNASTMLACPRPGRALREAGYTDTSMPPSREQAFVALAYINDVVRTQAGDSYEGAAMGTEEALNLSDLDANNRVSFFEIKLASSKVVRSAHWHASLEGLVDECA